MVHSLLFTSRHRVWYYREPTHPLLTMYFLQLLLQVGIELSPSFPKIKGLKPRTEVAGT